jgi:MFS transporter, NNP family, nitrate/nitrite transporter
VFFDKKIAGTSNALTAGFGNSGGGVTYFLMPAIYDSLVGSRGLTPHAAWRVAFIVPFIMILFVCALMLLCCPDTPNGKWSERHLHAQQNLASHGITGGMADVPPGEFVANKDSSAGSASPLNGNAGDRVETTSRRDSFSDREEWMSEQQMLDTVRGEIIRKPSFKEALPVIFSPQTLVTCSAYFCSFGAELSLNSILGAYYLVSFPSLGQAGSGRWAAMFGLLSAVFRPAGGFISDHLYRTMGLWGRKALIHAFAIIAGGFLLAIGLTNPHSEATLFGLVAGMAFFLEAGECFPLEQGEKKNFFLTRLNYFRQWRNILPCATRLSICKW